MQYRPPKHEPGEGGGAGGACPPKSSSATECKVASHSCWEGDCLEGKLAHAHQEWKGGFTAWLSLPAFPEELKLFSELTDSSFCLYTGVKKVEFWRAWGRWWLCLVHSEILARTAYPREAEASPVNLKSVQRRSPTLSLHKQMCRMLRAYKQNRQIASLAFQKDCTRCCLHNPVTHIALL